MPTLQAHAAGSATDSDLVPAHNPVKTRFPEKEIIVYVPSRSAIRGAAVELRAAASCDLPSTRFRLNSRTCSSVTILRLLPRGSQASTTPTNRQFQLSSTGRSNCRCSDESGFSERPSIQRSWAPRAETPVLSHRFGRWQNLSAIGAVAYSPAGRQARFFLMPVREAVRSEHIIRFLKLLRQHLPGPIILIWDGINPHRSLATRRFAEQQAWLTVVRLPAYAPELNPVEGAWSWFKRVVVGNFCPDGLDLLARVLRLARRRPGSRPPLLLGFLHKSGLSLP